MASVKPVKKAPRKAAGPVADAPTAGASEFRVTRRLAEELPLSDLHRVVGERIAERRRRKGWTSESLASKASISRSTLSALEHGRQDVSIGTVAAIAEALGVRVRDLFPT